MISGASPRSIEGSARIALISEANTNDRSVSE